MYNLSGNKGLGGVPSLPACPLFWENGSFSTGGKIVLAILYLVVFPVLLLVVYICCMRHDYDFALPHELMCKFMLETTVLTSYILAFADCVMLLNLRIVSPTGMGYIRCRGGKSFGELIVYSLAFQHFSILILRKKVGP